MSDYSWQDNNNSDNQNDPNLDSPHSPGCDNQDAGSLDTGTTGYRDTENENPPDYGRDPYGQNPYGYGQNDYQNNFRDTYQNNCQNNYSPDGYPGGSSPYENAPDRKYQESGSQGMATGALVLGICSILFLCCGISWIFGMIGIVLAILSRGAGSMNNSAKIGLGLSIGGSILGVIATIALIMYSFQSDYWSYMDNQFFEQYNDSTDDYDDLKDYFSDINV